MSYNKLESLPESFSEMFVAKNLNLSYNYLESLPDSFSEIIVAGALVLHGNPQLTGVTKNFQKVKGTVYR